MVSKSYAYQKEWRKNNPEKHKEHIKRAREVANAKDPNWQRKATLLREFGITLDEYNDMLTIQGNVCAICKQEETSKFKGTVRALAVDHNHTTGQVRGLLCNACNWSLGAMKENITYLKSAIEYLENWDKENG